MPARLGSLLLLSLLFGSPASAAWIPDTLASHTYTEYLPFATSDGSSGAIVAWFQYRYYQSPYRSLYVQHVQSGGSIDPSWPSGGLLVAEPDSEVAIVPDGAGGAIVAYTTNFRTQVLAHHVLANGNLDPTWLPGGRVLASTSRGYELRAVSDGTGGAIVVWTDDRNAQYLGLGKDIFAQRILATGVLDPAWPTFGLPVVSVTGDQHRPVVVGDGSGGVIAAWEDWRTSGDPDIFAQRLSNNGAISSGWATGGVQLNSVAGGQYAPRICSDGGGGAIVSWTDGRGIATDVYAMRVLSSGALGQHWARNGEAVSTATNDQTVAAMIADGAGGAIIAWSDQRSGTSQADVYAQKMSASGSSSWTNNGVAISTAADWQLSPSLASDGSGGAYVAWQDRRHQTTLNGTELYLHHLGSTGAPDPSWPANGGRVTFGGALRFGMGFDQPIVSNGSAAMVFWASDCEGGFQGDLDGVFEMGFNSTWTPRYFLNLTVSPVGGGAVTKDPDTASYLANTAVTVTATPATGYGFSSWSGDAGGSTNPLVVSMTSDKSITANFVGYPVTVAVSPAGAGSVTKSPNQSTYAPGTQVTLTASGSFQFLNWSGDASGNTNPLVVTVNGPLSITANFNAYTLTTTVSPAGLGFVQKSPFANLYAPGANVTLTATALKGASFSSWTGDLTGSTNPTNVVMDGNKSITANFAVPPPACGQWTLIPAASGPNSRGGSAAIWDPVRHGMVVFGGAQLSTGYNDVWRLTLGATPTWLQLTPSGPSKRMSSITAYDPVRDRMFIYGGRDDYTDPSFFYGDLWAVSLSGTPAWSQIFTSTPMGTRFGNSVVYDAPRDRLLFFGGSQICNPNCNALKNDVWALTLSGTPTWTQLTPAGSAPPTTSGHTAIYDPLRDRMIAFIGTATWALDLAGTPTWSNLSCVGFPANAGKAVYDPVRDRAIVLGAQLNTVSVLAFKNNPNHPLWAIASAGGTNMDPRGDWSPVYDPDDDLVLFFGGTGGPQPYFNDSWRLDLGGGFQLDAGGVNGTVSTDQWCYESGEVASVTAAAADGFHFQQWLRDASGTSNPLNITMNGYKVIEAQFDPGVTGVEEAPLAFALDIHPNPSVGPFDLVYSLPREARVRVRVFDVAGREIARPVDGVRAAGRHVARLGASTNGAPLRAGIYLVRYETPSATRSKRVALLR